MICSLSRNLLYAFHFSNCEIQRLFLETANEKSLFLSRRLIYKTNGKYIMKEPIVYKWYNQFFEESNPGLVRCWEHNHLVGKVPTT